MFSKIVYMGGNFVRKKSQNGDLLLILPLFGQSVVIEKVKVYEILWIFSLKNVNDISALFWRLSKAIHNVRHTCVPHYITGGAKFQPHQIFLFEKILNIKKTLWCNAIILLDFWNISCSGKTKAAVSIWIYHHLIPFNKTLSFVPEKQWEWWAKYVYPEKKAQLSLNQHNLCSEK